MSELLSWENGDGSVVVEIGDDDPGYLGVARRGDSTIGEVHQTFQDALSRVRGAAATALHTFRDTALGADEIELEFGVKLNAEAGAVIAKTAAEGHLTVKLTWRKGSTAAATMPRTEELSAEESSASSKVGANE